MNQTGKKLSAPLQALLLAALCLLAYLPGLGRQEFVGTEDFRARIAWEMAQSGEALVPTYYGRPILTKPPLHYWLLGRTLDWQGRRDPAAARLLSVLALAATVAMIAAAANRAGGPQAGWLAGLGYLLAANTWKNGANAEIDPLFAAFSVAMVLAWWRYLEGLHRNRAWPWALAAGVAGGLAAMAKGPALLPFLVGLGAATWWLRKKPQPGAVLALLLPLLILGLAWPAALQLADPDLEGAIAESAGKAVRWDGKAILKTLLYPLSLIGASLPLSIAAFWRLKNPGRPLLDRYLMATITGAFAMLMLSAGKGTRYLLPCFPLLCLAAALRLELLAASETFGRLIGWFCGLLALAGAFWAGTALPASGMVVLAALVLTGWVLSRRRQAFPLPALILAAVLSRAFFTQVYVPAWEAGEDSLEEAVEALDDLLGEAREVAVARLETPRLLDPLDRRIHYFDKPDDLHQALADGARFPAILLRWKDPKDDPPEYRSIGLVRIYGKTFRVYLPPSP
ncbi:MAG: phospholipid carrier-dependent glycosyltransferase [Planctomycetota bacterium]|nr:MAG: phospholipid carrier-dependent glycosyltransferase [Planctomycetota bacterium]